MILRHSVRMCCIWCIFVSHTYAFRPRMEKPLSYQNTYSRVRFLERNRKKQTEMEKQTEMAAHTAHNTQPHSCQNTYLKSEQKTPNKQQNRTTTITSDTVYISTCVRNPNFNLYTYRVAKTHRMPYLYRSFSAKNPYNQWLFCEK